MKKLLAGLLIAAAGAGTFFVLQKKQNNSLSFNKEWIIGKWKLDSLQFSGSDTASGFISPRSILAPFDSSLYRYQYVFTKQGQLLLSLGDSLTADSSRYTWNKQDLIVGENSADSADSYFRVLRLVKDSMKVQSRDSTLWLFSKFRQ